MLRRNLYFQAAVAGLVSMGLMAPGCGGPCNQKTDPDCVYRFVMIRDTVPPAGFTGTQTEGVDIYGVQLFHTLLANPTDAQQVHDCQFGSGDNSAATDCEYVVATHESACSGDEGAADYVSLGGEGGYVIVSFGGEVMSTDDIIRVYECETGTNGDNIEETYEVWTGVSTDPEDPSWLLCGDKMTGTEDCDVDLDQ